MRHVRRWTTSLATLVLIAACGNPSAGPAVEGVVSSLSLTTIEGAVFLPPVGPPSERSDFYADAELVYAVYEVLHNGHIDAEPLETIPAEARERFYLGTWRVSDTVAAHPGVTRVRVFAQASDFDGSIISDDPACRGQRACVIGSFDAMIQLPRNGRLPSGVLDLTSTQSLPIRVFLQRSPGSDADLRPTSLAELERLDGQPFTNPPGNCLVNEFSLPGQGVNALGAGVNALGAVGGVFVLDPAVTTNGFRLLAPAEAGAWAADLVTGAPSWSGAILVVDDFGRSGDAIALPEGLFPAFAGATDPQVFLTDLVAGGQLSHGALVLHQTLRLVEAAGFERVATPSPDFTIFARAGAGWPYLVVAAVDVGGTDLSSTNVAARIQRALDALQYLGGLGGDDFAVLDVAVNMSFVLVPCSVLDDYERAVETITGLTTFDDYVAALGAANGVAADFYAGLQALLLTPQGPASDPLRAQIGLCEGQFDEVARGVPIVPPPYTPGSAKIDPIAGPGRYVVHYGNEHTLTVDVSETPAGQMLAWHSTHPVGALFVKGGPGGTTYTYPNGAFGDSGLHAPVAPSGKYHDVSHVVVDFTDARPLAFLDEHGAWAERPWRELVDAEQRSEGAWDCSRGRISHVASSGNFALDYPLFPAAWDSVVAVGSQDATLPSGFGVSKSAFSNSGQVLAPGALYELSRSTDGQQVAAYAGTSFAAPVVSLFTALDLMRDTPRCVPPSTSQLTDEDDAGNTPLPAASCLAP